MKSSQPENTKGRQGLLQNEAETQFKVQNVIFIYSNITFKKGKTLLTLRLNPIRRPTAMHTQTETKPSNVNETKDKAAVVPRRLTGPVLLHGYHLPAI